MLASLICPAFGQLDRNGNQVSDLWESLYPSAVVESHFDSDGDGVTDREEAYAGTDPHDPESRLRIKVESYLSEAQAIYPTEVGKWYVLENKDFVEGGEWVALNDARVGNGSEMVWELPDRPKGYLRLRVFDLDRDIDGLQGWEEALLGLSDNDRYSNLSGATGTGFTDYVSAYFQLEGSGLQILADGSVVDRVPASRAEVHKFLNQATWGATPALTDEVLGMGIGAWLHSQLTVVPQRSITSAISGNARITASSYSTLATMGGIRAIMNHEDQVSLKVTQALSEILVASNQNEFIRQTFPLQREYYETLKASSFGTYRDLLEKITYNPTMGIYLSYVQNQKSDPATGRLPDENFAREIMQLFTIGLKELNQDGTPRLDAEGQEISTYDNEVITEMAKVFTGFGFGGPTVVQFFSVPNGLNRHYPMIMYDSFHELGTKRLFNDIVIPEGQTGSEDVDSALDHLCNHPNIGPFVSRLLIQRMVTSNPSSEYIARVAGVWNDDGANKRGNLKAVTRAILMDPEARGGASRSVDFGRIRGPFEQFMGLMRALEAKNESTGANEFPTYPINIGSLIVPLQQIPLWSPSVFNFYLPDHSPAGELLEAGLNAPELQIMTDTTAISVDNLIRRVTENGIAVMSTNPSDRIFLNIETAILLADSPEALLDYLDQVLLGGLMRDGTRA
ncbi:DUF1800 family protein, partial [bacterium]|nr:DUF1800 family protein [bacterium]